MHYVLLAQHDAAVCPTSNARTRDILLKETPEIPNIAKKNGVKILAGPFVNREHLVVAVVECDKPEGLDRFIFESGLEQWNSVRILPSQTMEAGLKELSQKAPIF